MYLHQKGDLRKRSQLGMTVIVHRIVWAIEGVREYRSYHRSVQNHLWLFLGCQFGNSGRLLVPTEELLLFHSDSNESNSFMASKQRNEKQISLLLYSTWTHTVVPLENFHQIFMGRQKCQAKVINQACKILTQSSILSKVLFFCLPNEYLIPWVDVFCHCFCCQLHLLALEGWPPCPQYQVTFPLSHPIFSCLWEGGWFLQTISSVYSAFSSSCIWSFLNVQCPLDKEWISPKLGCWNRQQHVGNLLYTVLVMKENFSFNSKRSAAARSLSWAMLFLSWLCSHLEL